MFNYLLRHFTIKNENGLVHIKGPFANINGVFERYLKTRTRYLFRKMTSDTMIIDEFFLYELYTILDHELFKRNTKSGFTYDQLFGTRDLKNLRDKLIEETYLKNIVSDYIYTPSETLDISAIEKKMTVKPLEHQEVIFKKYLAIKERFGLRGFVLDATTGSGKTLSSLMLAETLHSDVKIIIVPKNAVYKVWTQTFDTFYRQPQEYYVVGSSIHYNHEPTIICHYEGLKKLNSIVKDIPHGKRMVIIDESQNFNERKSDRSEFLLNIISELNPDDVLPMSGTPIKDKALEMVNLFSLLDPKFNKTVRNRYIKLYTRAPNVLKPLARDRYALIKLTISSQEVKKPPLTEEDVKITLPNGKDYLITKIRADMKKYIENRTKELKPLLPDYRNQYLELRSKAGKIAIEKRQTTQSEYTQYKLYVEQIVKAYNSNGFGEINDILLWVNKYERRVLIPNLENNEKKIFREAKTLYKYPALKLLGEALGKIVTSARINCYKDMARAIDFGKYTSMTERKVVVFSKYIDVARIAEETTKGLGSVGVYGEKSKDLDKYVKQFTEDKNINVLSTTYKSLSTAVPLIAANVELMIDLPFRHYEYEQAKGRIWRTNQEYPCFILKFELDTGDAPNISSRNTELILINQQNVAYLTGKNLDTLVEEEGVTSATEEFLDTFDIPTDITLPTFKPNYSW